MLPNSPHSPYALQNKDLLTSTDTLSFGSFKSSKAADIYNLQSTPEIAIVTGNQAIHE